MRGQPQEGASVILRKRYSKSFNWRASAVEFLADFLTVVSLPSVARPWTIICVVGSLYLPLSFCIYHYRILATMAQSGAGIQELMAAETRASQIVAEARMGE